MVIYTVLFTDSDSYFTYNYKKECPEKTQSRVFTYSSHHIPKESLDSAHEISRYKTELFPSMLTRIKADISQQQLPLLMIYELPKEFFPYRGDCLVSLVYPGNGILVEAAQILHQTKPIKKIFMHGYIKKSAGGFTGYKVVISDQKLSHAVEPDDQLAFLYVSEYTPEGVVPPAEASGPTSAQVRPVLSRGAMVHKSAGAATSAEEIPQGLCPLCRKNKKNAVIAPCGHPACWSCLEKMKLDRIACHQCEGRIVNIITVSF